MTGEIRKMQTVLNDDETIKYTLKLVDSSSSEFQTQDMSALVGSEIKLTFTGEIHCPSCGTKTKKSFMGFCYNCFVKVPEASECVLKPELCRGHLGEGRDIEWEEKNHVQPHIVYLAANDVVKVGVTRASQVPTRWIDQGASAAIRLAETPNRYTAGMIEVALKSVFTDKTNWRRMLKNETDDSIDLVDVKWELEELLPNDLSDYITDDEDVLTLNYPVLEFPEKVKSLNFDKVDEVSGKLMGIKGQYLIFDGGRVINIRRHIGYKISLEVL